MQMKDANYARDIVRKNHWCSNGKIRRLMSGFFSSDFGFSKPDGGRRGRGGLVTQMTTGV